MNTSVAFDAYRTRDLNIIMKTSSGDVLEMDFANAQSTSFSQDKTDKGSQTSFSFSSMQSFSFKLESNGIDAQDQKEIDAFMKIAQPFIDSFLEEFKDAAPKSPVTALANKIVGIFNPNKERDENNTNNVKTNIVKMFDNSLNKLQEAPSEDLKISLEDIFEQARKLLEKTLKEFDEFEKLLYA